MYPGQSYPGPAPAQTAFHPAAPPGAAGPYARPPYAATAPGAYGAIQPGYPPPYQAPYQAPYPPPYPGYPRYYPSSTWAAPVYPPVWTPPKPPTSSRTAIIAVLVALLVVGPIIINLFRTLTNPVEPIPTTQGPVNPTTPPGPVSTEYTPGPPDLNPGHPPVPTTNQIDSLLDNNSFYAQQTKPTQCEIGQIDLSRASTSQIEDYLNSFVNCLMAVWYPPVVTAGYFLPHPSVTVYTHQIHSPCGTLDTGNAVYCSADQQIYYAADLINYLPARFASTRFTGEAIIAHEFGHALQYRTMIMASEVWKEDNAATDAEQMEWSRRTELQADCFAGVFFNAIAASTDLTTQDESNITSMFEALGGAVPNSDDHGTGQSRGYWVTQGLSSSSPGVCSTYTAPSDEVS